MPLRAITTASKRVSRKMSARERVYMPALRDKTASIEEVTGPLFLALWLLLKRRERERENLSAHYEIMGYFDAYTRITSTMRIRLEGCTM